jgi:tetratricopeptide (TPR) repeat protein
VLAARIDRLPPEEKRLLQTAAVIGMTVSVPILQAVTGLAPADLYVHLGRLQAAEFLSETGRLPTSAYTFKHALTHEVAYESLLQEQRCVLHGRIVEILERLDPTRLAEQVERLAHHALRGEVWSKALQYCRQAGEKAMARPAYQEAMRCFEQALEALQHLPVNRATMEQAIDLRCDLYNALLPFGRWEQMLASLHEAEMLAETLGDQCRLGRVWSLLANIVRNLRDYDRALLYCQRTQAIATALGDVGLQRQALYSFGQVYRNLGDSLRAIDCLRKSMAFLQGERLYEGPGTALPSGRDRGLLVQCLADAADALSLVEQVVGLPDAGMSRTTVSALSEGRSHLRDKAVELLQIPRRQEGGNIELIHACGLEATELFLDLCYTPGQHGISGAFLTEPKALHQAMHQAFTVFRVVGNGHGHIRGVGDLGWVTAYGVAVPGEHLAFVAQGLGTAPDVPVIGVFGRNTQRTSFTTAANQQFGVRLLQRLGEQRGLGKLIVLTVESRGGLGPQPEQHLAGFFKTVQTFADGIVRNPIGHVLIALPGSTYTTDETSTGYDVHRRGHFRDDSGMAIGVPDHEGTDTQTFSGQRQAGEGGPAL